MHDNCLWSFHIALSWPPTPLLHIVLVSSPYALIRPCSSFLLLCIVLASYPFYFTLTLSPGILFHTGLVTCMHCSCIISFYSCPVSWPFTPFRLSLSPLLMLIIVLVSCLPKKHYPCLLCPCSTLFMSLVFPSHTALVFSLPTVFHGSLVCCLSI